MSQNYGFQFAETEVYSAWKHFQWLQCPEIKGSSRLSIISTQMSINAHGYLVPRVCYIYLERKVALQAVGCTGMPRNMSFELDSDMHHSRRVWTPQRRIWLQCVPCVKMVDFLLTEHKVSSLFFIVSQKQILFNIENFCIDAQFHEA